MPSDSRFASHFFTCTGRAELRKDPLSPGESTDGPKQLGSGCRDSWPSSAFIERLGLMGLEDDDPGWTEELSERLDDIDLKVHHLIRQVGLLSTGVYRHSNGHISMFCWLIAARVAFFLHFPSILMIFLIPSNKSQYLICFINQLTTMTYNDCN